MLYPKIPIFILAAAMSTSTLVVADDDDEEPFDVAELFFELNDTDGDLGIHGDFDGDDWKKLTIEDPKGRRMMKVRAHGRLKRQGLTEISFESAEPCFPDDEECEDPLDPDDFFGRFPEGWYEVEGKTLDGDELESEVWLSHVIPAAPEVAVNEVEPEDDCVEDVELPVTLSWPAVTEAHEELGKDPGSTLASHNISVVFYEVVLEVDDTDFKSTSIVPGDVTSFELPGDFFDKVDAEEYKFEVLVRIDNGQDEDDDGEEIDPGQGNKTAMEGCFVFD